MNLSTDALQWLWSATLATAIVALLLMLLPRLLRRRFGAGVAYAVWCLVPVALIASLLPARDVETASVDKPVPTALQTMIEPVLQPITVATVDHSALWLSIWLAGAVLMALRLWLQQRRFVRGLGAMRPLRDDLWKAQARHGLPALLGVLQARIVLPEDFNQRFDPRERQLMLAHERRHRSHGDHIANLAVAAARTMFWFNPLVHLAATRFRHDQELACDQAVIAAYPDSRRAYGEAMLKTLMAERQAPLGCHWGFSHPLKERVMHLKTSAPRPWARRLGTTTVALLALGTGFAVWSAQPARAPQASISTADTRSGSHRLDVTLRIDGEEVDRFAMENPDGHRWELTQQDGKGVTIGMDGTVRRLKDGRFEVAMVLDRNGRNVGKPRLVVAEGEPSTVKVGDEKPDGSFAGVELVMVVTDASRTPPPAPPAPPAPPHPPAAHSQHSMPSPPEPPSPRVTSASPTVPVSAMPHVMRMLQVVEGTQAKKKQDDC